VRPRRLPRRLPPRAEAAQRRRLALSRRARRRPPRGDPAQARVLVHADRRRRRPRLDRAAVRGRLPRVRHGRRRRGRTPRRSLALGVALPRVRYPLRLAIPPDEGAVRAARSPIWVMWTAATT